MWVIIKKKIKLLTSILIRRNYNKWICVLDLRAIINIFYLVVWFQFERPKFKILNRHPIITFHVMLCRLLIIYSSWLMILPRPQQKSKRQDQVKSVVEVYIAAICALFSVSQLAGATVRYRADICLILSQKRTHKKQQKIDWSIDQYTVKGNIMMV